MRKIVFGMIGMLEVVGVVVFLYTATNQPNSKLVASALSFALLCGLSAGLATREVLRKN